MSVINTSFRNKLLQLIIIGMLAASDHSFAIRESRPIPTDSRIRVITYSPDDVIKFVGYYNFQTTIELGSNEEVVSVSMGDTTGWQVVPAGNRIFIKPIEQDATTNMTLITNKRTYFFELYAHETNDIRDPDMVFHLRFIYPDDEEMDYAKTSSSAGATLDFAHPEKYNFNYSISGYEEIAPIKVFDDGEFMYLQFRGLNSDLPAIFAVDEELRESMVNYHLSKDHKNMIVVEHVFQKLTVRYDKKFVCVFNEAFRKY